MFWGFPQRLRLQRLLQEPKKAELAGTSRPSKHPESPHFGWESILHPNYGKKSVLTPTRIFLQPVFGSFEALFGKVEIFTFCLLLTFFLDDPVCYRPQKECNNYSVYVCSTSPHCVLANVSLNCLLGEMQIGSGCICSSFLRCEF